MKKQIVTVLILFAVLGGFRPAAEAAQQLDQSFFQQVYRSIVLAGAPWSEENIEIENFLARPESLTVPDGRVSWRQGQDVTPSIGRRVVNLTLLVDGQDVSPVRMIGDVQLFGKVVVLKKRLSRHTVIAESDIEVVRRNISSLGADLLGSSDLAVGKRLKASTLAGAFLSRGMLEETPLVQRGDLVTIVIESESFRITALGQARSAGARDEVVRVKNLTSRREILARVLTSDTVAVDL